ncbi:MAG: hypothetical protein JJE30_16160 [Desulfuromonadales bacterium]|jgi:hypothetical protein|nr:hypothetical protein [Desulfuromonadales bacterium]
MRRSILLSVALFLSLSVSAFAAESAKPAKAVHGAKDAKPGSYEDWCSEHGVPESMDTRCDKSLIPAFKATGDWDEKHGLPKSQCKKCNPKLKIVRPPKGSK